MIIKCPICGPREASEFTYLGDASVRRPDVSNTEISEWSDYVHQRENTRGNHNEHWQHSAGCRSILKVNRDTVSHVISDVKLEGPWS